CRQRFLSARKPRAPLFSTLDPTDEATFPAMDPSTSCNRSTGPRDRSAGARGELHSSRSHSRSRSQSQRGAALHTTRTHPSHKHSTVFSAAVRTPHSPKPPS
ncbi:unnamed protein product, partial [Ixodes pacificus]